MLLLVLLCLLPKMYSSIETPKGWVDPYDMRYYDRTTKTMKYSYTASDLESCGIYMEIQEENERLQIFIERFINQILQSANLKDRIMKPGSKIVTEIPVSITAEELDKLAALGRKFKASDLNDLNYLLSVMLSYERGFTFDSLVSYLNPIEELFFNMSMEKVVVIICISISFITIWMFAVGKSFKKIMLFLYLICFLGGLAFNAWHMYMEAISEQIAESKNYMAVPNVCDPKKTSWWSFLFSSRNECLEFEKTMRINPLSKVIPSVVFSHTLSMMFIHPLKDVGARCGDFLVGVSKAAPWPLNWIFLPFVLVVFCLLFFFVVMAHMGASFNCWTWLGGLSINQDKSKNNSNKSYEALIDELRCMKKYMKSEIKENRIPEAGDASQATFQKRHSIASSSLLEMNRENNLFSLNSNTDVSDKSLNLIFKVNRKSSLVRHVNPNSITIKKKYK